MFILLGIFGTPGIIFWIVFALTLFIKLTLNAVDGIIARERQESTQLGMVLNVGTDILPDLLIIASIWYVFSLLPEYFLIMGLLVVLYFIGELIFIYRYSRQNFFYGKDLRTLTYFALMIVIVA
jgi:phosphatidylglycerophosphate synthase